MRDQLCLFCGRPMSSHACPIVDDIVITINVPDEAAKKRIMKGIKSVCSHELYRETLKSDSHLCYRKLTKEPYYG